MKTIVLSAAACVLGAFTGSASAQVYGDTARVVSSTPIYDKVSTPRRECRMEQVTAYEERRTVREAPPAPANTAAGTVLGAIVGGVIGHQFGNSTGGRDHGTAAGAVVGGLVGNSIARNAADEPRQEVTVHGVPVTREVQRCDTIADARDVIVGYDVRYEYNGREFRTRLANEPGPQIPVNVEVRTTEQPVAERAPVRGPRTPVYRGTSY